jgi:hypothetical protein
LVSSLALTFSRAASQPWRKMSDRERAHSFIAPLSLFIDKIKKKSKKQKQKRGKKFCN